MPIMVRSGEGVRVLAVLRVARTVHNDPGGNSAASSRISGSGGKPGSDDNSSGSGGGGFDTAAVRALTAFCGHAAVALSGVMAVDTQR